MPKRKDPRIKANIERLADSGFLFDLATGQEWKLRNGSWVTINPPGRVRNRSSAMADHFPHAQQLKLVQKSDPSVVRGRLLGGSRGTTSTLQNRRI
jgi:hypothetical protein